MNGRHTRVSMAKAAAPIPALVSAPVYVAEADPRQVKASGDETDERVRVAAGANEECTSEFGPWVRAADGSWMRDRNRRKGGK